MKRLFLKILIFGTSITFGFILGMLYSFVGILGSF